MRNAVELFSETPHTQVTTGYNSCINLYVYDLIARTVLTAVSKQ